MVSLADFSDYCGWATVCRPGSFAPGGRGAVIGTFGGGGTFWNLVQNARFFLHLRAGRRTARSRLRDRHRVATGQRLTQRF